MAMVEAGVPLKEDDLVGERGRAVYCQRTPKT
jgi:hypothetical protein